MYDMFEFDCITVTFITRFSSRKCFIYLGEIGDLQAKLEYTGITRAEGINICIPRRWCVT